MRKLLGGGVLLGSLALLFLGLCGLLDPTRPLRSPWLPSPSNSGYVDDSPPPTWKIGVLGDSQKGLANLRNITRKVVDEDVHRIIHTGDFVADNDDGHYYLAYRYMLRAGVDEATWPLVAPGNHDLKGGAERFQKWFPLERVLLRYGVAFVILDNAFGRPPPDPKRVQKLIDEAGSHKALVLAMHQPPIDLDGNPKPEYAEFLAWLEKSKVSYLLCGHLHGYTKKKVGDTTVIINGVGGDYDKWQLDQKVYATILEIEGSKIRDRRIETEPAHELWENIEHFAIGHVAEAYVRHPILCWAGTLLLIGGVGAGWVRLLRRPGIPKPA